MNELIKSWLYALAGFAVLDGLWLGLLMNDFYRTQLAALARMTDGRLTPVWSAAAGVYVLLGLGIAVFVVPRSLSALDGARFGALLGLVVYGVYELTNYATLRGWPAALTLVDIAWGTAATALVAAGVVALVQR